ncbi:hypothetical protein A2833_02205 [Candidatus Azambacteria bacterium RIFCSPHIGHO2_01_FULL_44_55]|uniref:Uncharacterized protein n=1 Tax=Candidatus Azambacteria bacterium RIFCSPLOWO2_02_FULL_44_14 TaxID=1797306 RepID=A0A1F5CCN2_9BACT|nr:MAG: hypothetical protein A3A18_01575 [Candidatus Azambacteria bacterium RIFCSPLOWO2_01_FULL_44_84]OGD32968.1 MAG: hypothetical protein A3C78_00360 [Candidatus Azambacteria bacterium RIFCSPHIGHO2_02_FULL_45_18]OGD40412.1 MAG: hypothetical protein A2833_02205 [Candidatus Azambacteria bacterium RIFCSPHIGHO2_01_FULL_44_55]OGD40624.1 MAG: hypothetical protein A3I30_01225 [Candidatus Azambacteria bacterium RIFCSPLOWO2_02_FULL_44_14]
MKTLRLLFWLLIGVALSLALAVPARAEYLPNAEFLAKMEKMLALAGGQNFGEFYFREVKAGKTYRDGDIAYFTAAASDDTPDGEMFMQLEEWRIQPDGNFKVTYTKMWPHRAVRWSLTLTPTGTRVDSGGIYEELLWNIRTMPEPPSDLTEKSERAQELLRDHGRPVMIGGVAI